MKDAASYYKHQGAMTAAGEYAVELAALPADLAALCEIVQGLLIHRDMAPFLYRVTLSEQRVEEAHIRPVAEMLTHMHTLDSRAIKIARETDRRMAGVCRHFAILLTAILREQGIAARARCGFGTYFTPGKFEDHWVCEYWSLAKSRWILVDAQMDRVQREAFNLDFDPLDVPRDRFIIAGDAWRMCREGGAAPNHFGLSHIGLQGLWFVAGNVLRDFAALNRMEMLPWDVWGAMPKPEDEVDNETLAVIDRIAALTIASDDALPEIHSTYDRDERLRVPHVVFNALRNAPEVVTP
jgi:hypothetical protein